MNTNYTIQTSQDNYVTYTTSGNKKMNNYEKIKNMSIEEMAETIANFACVCVFETLKKINILNTSLYSKIDDETKQEYVNMIEEIVNYWLEGESEE